MGISYIHWRSPVKHIHNKNEFVHVMKTSQMCLHLQWYKYDRLSTRERERHRTKSAREWVFWTFADICCRVMVEPSLYCIYSKTIHSVWSARFNFTQHDDESANILYIYTNTHNIYIDIYILGWTISTLENIALFIHVLFALYITRSTKCWRINTVWKNGPEW